MLYEYRVISSSPISFKNIESYTKLDKGDVVCIQHLNSTGFSTYWIVEDVLKDVFSDDTLKLSPFAYKSAVTR